MMVSEESDNKESADKDNGEEECFVSRFPVHGLFSVVVRFDD